MSQQQQPILFLGATGGCALNALTHTLNAGYKAVALARTPAKLSKMLQEQGLDKKTIANVAIVEGNAHSVESMKVALTKNQPAGTIAPLIICGVGGAPRLQASLFQPVVVDQPDICAKAISTAFTAIKELHASNKATLLTISTTGITGKGERSDLPRAMYPLYHYFLSSPHVDKHKAEELLTSDAKSASPILRSNVIVRPSLLMGTAAMKDAKGLEKVKVGTGRKPAVGYTIARADVGRWIFEEVVQGFGKSGRCQWEGEKVSLTY